MENEDWGDESAVGSFSDPDGPVKLPPHIQGVSKWLRPTEYIKQPEKPAPPELTPEEKAEQERKAAEAEKAKKGKKSKAPAKKDEEPEEDNYLIVPQVVNAEDPAAPIARTYFKAGFTRVWSEQQKEDINKEAAEAKAREKARQEAAEARAARQAEAEELGEEFLDEDEAEEEDLALLEEPEPVNRVPEGPEIEASIASLLRVICLHPKNVDKSDPFLWEAIYPKDASGNPRYNPAGKYCLKVFFSGKWRKLTIDDTVPVNDEGDILLTSSQTPGELWPTILAKAIYKMQAIAGIFDDVTGLQSAASSAFAAHILTSWLPKLLPALEGEAGEALLIQELPEEKKEEDDEQEEVGDSASPADEEDDDKVAEDAGTDGVGGGDGAVAGALTDGDGTGGSAADDGSSAAGEDAIGVARTSIALMCTSNGYTVGGDSKPWTDVTSPGEVCTIKEIKGRIPECQVHVHTTFEKPMWIPYDEIENEEKHAIRVVVLYTKYEASSCEHGAALDCGGQR